MVFPAYPCELGFPDRVLTRIIAVSTDQPNGCRLVTGMKLQPNGYVQMGWRVQGRKMREYAHRIVCAVVHGPIPPGYHVAHRCDTRHCVNPACLVAVPPSANNADKAAKGRSNRAERHWNWKGGISRNFQTGRNRNKGAQRL